MVIYVVFRHLGASLYAVIPARFVRTFRPRLTAEKPLAGLRPDTLSCVLYLVQTLKDSTLDLRHQLAHISLVLLNFMLMNR
jgi:hypothetical protein